MSGFICLAIMTYVIIYSIKHDKSVRGSFFSEKHPNPPRSASSRPRNTVLFARFSLS